jgi:hypothetical protein
MANITESDIPSDQWKITVQFTPQLRSDGELVRVTILQRRNYDEEQIILTEEQARSLVAAINARFGDKQP